MDAVKKARWKERDQRRKIKRRDALHPRVMRFTQTPRPPFYAEGRTWGRFSSITTPVVKQLAPAEVARNLAINSDKYKAAVNACETEAELRAVMLAFGTL